jgi:hypothetical protein
MSDALRRLESGLADRYRIDRELGRGGMATVYLADDVKHRRSVAVKVLLPELASVVGSERFLREIDIAARLRHPHVLPLLDSGSVDGLLYYVMPLVEGESLRDKLNREKQLPVDEALAITNEVIDALSYSHAHGVIHRDIKPSNIIQDVSTERLTASGLSPGSPQYMSPEQAAGEQNVDGRSDVYSLGCVLFEMLTGDPPFTGSIPQAILAKKLMESVPHLRVVRDSAPEHVEQAVTIALAKSPADRFGTVEEFGRALSGDFGDRVVVSETESSVVAPGPGASVSRVAGTVMAITAGLGALLTAIGFLSTRVYDLKLRIPIEHTPSRTDFAIVGAKALVPAVIFCFVGVVVYVSLRFMWRGTWFGLRRIPAVGQTLKSIQHRSTNAWQQLWQPVKAATVGDAYFIGGIVGVVVLLGFFRNLLSAMWGPDSEVLSCPFRPLHHTYSITMSLVTAVLALAWLKFDRYLRRRRVIGGRASLAKWGGLAWVVIVAIVMTMPWRLLWDNDHPRALLDGERTYILMETDTELLIYRPGTQSTERISGDEGRRLERLGTSGYLFEDSVAFRTPLSGC